MSTFPPASIAAHTESIVDQCETAEMTPSTDPAVPVSLFVFVVLEYELFN